MVDSIWNHAFKECLLIDPKEHPMLLAEPSSNSQQQRERTAELIFEKYNVPALFLAKNAVLTSFASGHATWLVVDGMHNDIRKKRSLELVHFSSLSCMLKLRTLKLCNDNESSYSNIPLTPYELPDGQTIEIGADRFKIPDILFNPSLVQTIPGMANFVEIAPDARGLPQMAIESINKCDVDIRRELYSSILLAGGTASMQQLKERLEKDLLEESPQAARVKVLASGNATERRFSVWIGCSILASLGSFQQTWFSKSEYEEHGVSYVQRKCP
ncbi:actin-related protein [Salix suchowensis]|nr:actin-related protein [Salix suchowensis]